MHLKYLAIILLIIFLILTSCAFKGNKMVSIHSLPHDQTVLKPKNTAPKDYRDLFKLNLVNESISSGGDWYDGASFLYITENQGEAHLYKYDLFSKQNKLIYKNKYPILDVSANSDHSLFAVKLGAQVSMLQIIDKSGEVVYQWNDKAVNYDIIWNPYNPQSLLIAAYFNNWSYQVYSINVGTKQIKKVPLKDPYGQWMGPHSISDLKWGQGENSNKATLSILDLDTNKQQFWKKDIINYVTLGKNMGLILTAKSLNDKTVTYSFYHLDDRKKVAQLNIPSIQTYSEFWWIPYYQYLNSNHCFYYFSPVRNEQTSMISFQFNKFDVINNKQEMLLTDEKNQPFKVSPNGQWLLYGNHYYTLISLLHHKQVDIEKNK